MKKTVLILAVFLWSGLQIALAQSRPIRGKVLDDKGQPVEAATVAVKDGDGATQTDETGNFQIDVPDDKDILVIDAMGYSTVEVEAGDGSQPLNVTLGINTSTLDEAVIIGYGTTTYRQLNGASSVVKEQAFKDIPMGSFTNMLQGQAAGVQITSQNGAPGATAFIRIRGASSINGGVDPLIVIDGVPSTAEALNSINNNDIADVTILKDASTTSIYGSRGANGVVVVTTKKGKANAENRPTITYGFQYGWRTKTPDKYDMMNFDQKLKWERDMGYTNQYLQEMIAEDGYESIDQVPDAEVGKYWEALRPYETNWLSHKKGENPILRVGKFKQHDLAISGTSDRISYYMSGQLYDEDGIAMGSFFNRKAGSVNIDYRATNWLKVGQIARVSYNNGRLVRDRFNVQNPFAAMYFYNPYESPYDYGVLGVNGYNQTVQGFNYVESLPNNPSFYNNFYLSSTTYAEVKPMADLTIRTQIGMQYNNYQQENFTRPGSILDLILNGEPVGSKTDINDNRFNYVWTNTAEYKKMFGDDHNFSALIGTEWTKDNSKAYSMTSTGYPYGVSTQENGGKPTATTTSRAAWTLMSYFMRLQYSYKGKYSINLSGRRDGSSRFGNDTKWGNFGAVGASWMLSDEEFLKNVHGIDYIKLWGSVGTSGNQNIGNYTRYQLNYFMPYNNIPTASPRAITAGNDSLTWEKNLNYSLGVDFGFINNRISGTFDIYGRKTYDLLFFEPISSTVGFSQKPTNLGTVKNNGVELNINADIIRTKDFVWSVGGNFTHNKNKVTDLNGKDTVESVYSLFGYNVIGQPIDVYYLQKYAGVDRETGLATWYTQNGGVTDDYSQAGLFVLEGKSPDPKYFGGFYTNLAYKGIELGINFSYSGGNWTYNNQWMQANLYGNYYQNLSTEMLDYWTPENPNAKNPIFDENDGSYDSDRWLEKADYLRLRNITLAYNFPSKWFDNKIQGLRVYVQGQNLWYTAKGYHGDPEIGIGSDESDLTRVGNTSLYSYPISKAITIGLNVTF